MAEPVIQVHNLKKTYHDGTEAVKGVSFHVHRGEIFGLLGPNGAGKTTTMRILGTLHSHSGGTASVLGFDVKDQAKEIRARIGFAMQEVGMDDLATAEEMVRFHGRLAGMGKQEAEARARELLRIFDLEEHAGRRVTRFSGGMQRRLDLAVSLVHRPEVMFLDEPSTGLDPKSRADLWNILRELRRDHGLTIVMSTHYMEEADELCDRIAIITDGRIAAIDTPEKLKRDVGDDQIIVRAAKAPDTKVAAALRKRFPRRVTIEDDQVRIKVKDGGDALLATLQAVDKAGVTVASTRVRTPTLDDVFLQYTGQRLEVE